MSQIREFFKINGPNGIDHLDAIGFVIQNSVNRLTPTQKYIFESILSIFGNDVSSNMFSIITFADGQVPPVLKAIEEVNVPSIKHFKFNNSALFAKNKVNDDEENINIDEMFWKIGISSLKNFFNELSKVEAISLTLTKEVLNERQRLEVYVQGIQQQMQIALGKLEELKQEMQVFKEHSNNILKNELFTYTISVTKQHKVDLPKGTYVTNCLRCNYTCHYPCGIVKDEEKYRCDAMNRKDPQNAQCTVCPDKCSWNSHINNCYCYTLYQEDEIRTNEDMRQRYLAAKTDSETIQNICEGLKNDFRKTKIKVYGMINCAREAIVRLDQIALKPNPLTIVNYIDLIIESEEQEAKHGWKQRIEHLTEAKKGAGLIQHIKDEEYGDILLQLGDLDYHDNE
ncbi:unnamed protein product [Rotaria sp. Silwood2]|nr:unnamed protein product [Rotaria sp. Silwood2]CAF2852870.1 unnamed protein product [Rotaria sp. Silwood2]CAF4099346.1 unnamed protein product [Rotaria sp. Silwood2]CAF4227256.1 unnamed protein product [Rotaria sp. Silwood2]